MDAPRAVHRGMVMGIEGREIFGSDTDRNHFVLRVGDVLQGTWTRL
jgi:hypothetical protein